MSLHKNYFQRAIVDVVSADFVVEEGKEVHQDETSLQSPERTEIWYPLVEDQTKQFETVQIILCI